MSTPPPEVELTSSGSFEEPDARSSQKGHRPQRAHSSSDAHSSQKPLVLNDALAAGTVARSSSAHMNPQPRTSVRDLVSGRKGSRLDDAEAQLDSEELRKKSCLFPCDCLFCCPDCFCPSAYHNFQSWTHLMLVLGMLASLVLAVRAVFHIYERSFSDDPARRYQYEAARIQDILVVVFMCPCLLYFVKAISRYDGDLRTKKKQQLKAQRALRASLQGMLNDMIQVLEDMNEKCSGFSQSCFDNSQRDFIKFLVRERNSDRIYDEARMLPEMIQFCSHWFRVFEQCSVDPFNKPTKVMEEEDLQRCTTVGDVLDVCLSRLEGLRENVEFIGQRMDADKKKLDASRSRLEGMGRIGQLVSEGQSSDIQAHFLGLPLGNGRRKSCFSRMSWLRLECRCDFAIDPRIVRGGWPKMFRIGCGCLILLSREHVMLIAGFFMGWVVFAFEFVSIERPSKIWNLVTILIVQFCLACTLVRFEAIDILQRLEKEREEYAKEERDIKAKNVQMKEFWGPVHNLQDLWLYRTTPCMDLLHELQCRLEDIQDSQEALKYVMSANRKLSAFFERLGSLKHWSNDGILNKDQKEEFAQAMTKVVNQATPEGMMRELDICYQIVDNNIPPPDLGGLGSFLA